MKPERPDEELADSDHLEVLPDFDAHLSPGILTGGFE